VNDRLEGPGWWQASDGHWYPPQTHPDYQPPEIPVRRRRHSAPKPPFYRRPWFLVAAAVVVIVAVITATGGPANNKPDTVALTAGATTPFTISGFDGSSIGPVVAPGADFVSSATTAAPASGAASGSAPAVRTTAPPSTSSVRAAPKLAPTSTPPPVAAATSPRQAASLHPAPTPGCHATMANATPGEGATDNLTVTSDVPNTAATVTAHYPTTDYVFALRTNAAGGALLRFSIGRPTPGFTVDVSVVVGGGMCWTSFDPR
jgi:hypothetical protein